MKTPRDLFLEITSSDAVPADGGFKLPGDVVDAWKASLDYDKRMKRKFSYFDIAFKTDRVTRGHKGHITKTQNTLVRAIEAHGLDVNETVKRLYQFHPPRHF